MEMRLLIDGLEAGFEGTIEAEVTGWSGEGKHGGIAEAGVEQIGTLSGGDFCV
jgi:hypothetical protein